MFRVTLIVYLRCKTFFFHACMLLCLSECDKISRWPVLHFKVHIYTTLNIMYPRKYFCINIKFPNVLDSKHIFPYWFKYICKKPTFSRFLYKKLVFSLPKNVRKSAVRNFLSAFGAPGEFIISLLLSGGLSYLFKIRFLVFFPLLPSYALGVVVQDIFQAILYVAEAFAAFLRSSSWLCLSSQIWLLWPLYRTLALTRKHPQDRLSKTLIRKLPLHKLLIKCKRYGLRSHLIYCASLSRFPSCRS